MNQKNFLGMPAHKSDRWLHYTDDVEVAQALRNLFESVPEEHHKAIEILMERAYNLGGINESDSNSGESL
jgi:hypothetical protein